MSSTKSESEESEWFHFLPIPLMTPMLMFQWKLDRRGLKQKQKRKNQPVTMPGLFFGFRLWLWQSTFHWIISIGFISGIRRKWNHSDSSYDSGFRFSLDRKRSYDSDYDSDSAASENQSIEVKKSLSHAQSGLPWGFNSRFPKGIPTPFTLFCRMVNI